MKILIEESVLRQALQAAQPRSIGPQSAEQYLGAITALRETLNAAEKVEPVAWYYRFKNASGWGNWQTTPVGAPKPVNLAFEDIEIRPLVFGDPRPAPAVPDYTWPTVQDYERDVGWEVNVAFQSGWDMARTTNRFLSKLASPTPQAAPEGWRCVPALLFEAHDYGQFADDFDHQLAKPIRKAIRDMLSAAPTPPANTPAWIDVSGRRGGHRGEYDWKCTKCGKTDWFASYTDPNKEGVVCPCSKENTNTDSELAYTNCPNCGELAGSNEGRINKQLTELREAARAVVENYRNLNPISEEIDRLRKAL